MNDDLRAAEDPNAGPKHEGGLRNPLSARLSDDWSRTALGWVATLIVPMRDKPNDLDGEIPWVRIEDFDGKWIGTSKTEQGVSPATVRAMNLKVMPVGTVLCTCSCSMGATAVVTRPLVTNQTFIGIVPDDRLDSSFLFYLMRAASEELQSLATGAIQQYLSREDFSRLRIPLPPRDGQVIIADFLDRETERIDALVAKKRRLIELLREKRTALISHAVTKGLDPDVPMKDSGIEWLGAIPKHWQVARLKHLTSVTVGIVVTPAKYYVQNGVPCLRSLNVSEEGLTKVDLVYISEESNRLLAKSMLHERDVVVVRTGKPGTAAVVDAHFDGANCIDLIVIRRSAAFDSDYIANTLNSPSLRARCAGASDGAIQQHFNIETAKNLLLPCPPIDEQRRISEWAVRESDRLRTVGDKVTAVVFRFSEYRSALITAAVTGQIDVRTYRRDPEEALEAS